MSSQSSSPWRAHAPLSWAPSFWAVAIALTLLHVLTLVSSSAQLGPDESQYWFWSRTPAFGYFSKPPLIAWAIAATTALFGNTEWAVRLSAPLFHFGAAAFLYLTARKLFNARVAYWTGLGWLTMPGVTLSSFLIATDAPLLFFWAAGLFFCFRIAEAEKAPLTDFAALGAAIGLGLLSKYAMLYFIAALAVAIIVFPAFRRAFARAATILAVLIAAVLIAPNIAWNAAHDFQTVAHTAANANWGANLFRPLHLVSFLGEQFAVAGLIFAGLVWRAAMQFRTPDFRRAPNAALYVFALTPLLIVSAQAFISQAHANWAAAAYPAAVIIVVAWLFQHRAGRLAKAGIVLHTALAFLFMIVITHFSLIDAVGLSSTVKRIRGWEKQSHAIAAMAKGEGYDAVMLDDRAMMGAMLYYERGTDLEIVAIDPNAHISNHYEAFKAFDPRKQKRVLFVTTRDDAAHVDYRFHNITPLGPTTVELGRASRTYHLFDVSGYFGKGAP